MDQPTHEPTHTRCRPCRAQRLRRGRRRLVTVLALTGALLIGAGGADVSSYAATGDSLILGRINHAGRTTTLSTHGDAPALRLKTSDGPPLAVSSSAKVAHLNADKVDGRNAAALGVSVHEFRLPESQGFSTFYGQDVPDLKSGESYELTYAITVTFPEGEKPSPVMCAIGGSDPRPGTTAHAWGSPVPVGGTDGVSGYAFIGASGVVDVNADAPRATMWCRSDAKFAVLWDDAYVPYVLVTPLTRHTGGTFGSLNSTDAGAATH